MIITKPKLLAFAIILLVGSASFYLGQVLASPSPTISRVVTTGNTGPCTWFVSLDGTTPVAQAMIAGLSVNVGDNMIGTAGQDMGTFMNALTTQNQQFCFSPQTFTFSSTWNIPAVIETVAAPSWTIRGSSLTGDAYFTKLQAGAAPYGTVFQSASGFTGTILYLGQGASGAPVSGQRNAEISYITFSGMQLPYTGQGSAGLQMTAGNACLKMLDIENTHVHDDVFLNCNRGIYLTTNSGDTNDGDEFNHIWFGYNRFGLWIDGQSQVVVIHDIYGYLNYGNFLYIAAINADIYNVFSNADDYELLNAPNATINFITNGFIRAHDLYIANGKSGARAGVRGIQIYIGIANATAIVTDSMIDGVNGDGIAIQEASKPGRIYISRVFASPDTSAFLGGIGSLNGYGVKAGFLRTDNLKVYVDSCDFTDANFGSFYGNFTSFTNIQSFLNQQSGTSTISAGTSVIVTHALGDQFHGAPTEKHVSPTYVLITPITTVAADSWVDTLTTTQFTIHLSASGTVTFQWLAFYSPNGVQVGP